MHRVRSIAAASVAALTIAGFAAVPATAKAPKPPAISGVPTVIALKAPKTGTGPKTKTIKVGGKNFPIGYLAVPTHLIAVTQCTVGAANSDSCDISGTAFAASEDSKGSVAKVPFTVHDGAVGTLGGHCNVGESCTVSMSAVDLLAPGGPAADVTVAVTYTAA